MLERGRTNKRRIKVMFKLYRVVAADTMECHHIADLTLDRKQEVTHQTTNTPTGPQPQQYREAPHCQTLSNLYR